MNTNLKNEEFAFDTKENLLDKEEDDLFIDDSSDIDERQEQIVNELINEFTDNRKALRTLITDLEDLKAKIDKIFPSELDARYLRFFEDKVKAATQLFSAILDIRKEIAKGIKTEIDIRKNSNFNKKNDETITQEELRKIAGQLDNLKKVENKTFKAVIKTKEKVNDNRK